MQVTLTPGGALNNEGIWQNLEGLLTTDGNWAISPSGAGYTTVFVNDWSAGLPQDIAISGIQVTIVGGYLGSASASPTLQVSLSTNSSTTSGQIKSISLTGSGLSTYTAGSSGDNWSVNWKRSHIHGNTNFAVAIIPSGDSTVSYIIDSVTITIWYDLVHWLQGERNLYPYGYDRVKTTTNPNGNLPKQHNGTGPEHQIKSEDVNLLGDCLYSIQLQQINESSLASVVRAIGNVPGNQLNVTALTCTLTGTVSSPAVVNFHNTYKITNINSGTPTASSIKTTNLTSVKRTESIPTTILSNNPARLYFTFISAIGWIVKSGSGSIQSRTQPVHISPRNILIDNRSNVEYIILGFTALGADISHNISYSDGTTYHQSYTTPAPVPAGTLIVKFFGLSEPQPAGSS